MRTPEFRASAGRRLVVTLALVTSLLLVPPLAADENQVSIDAAAWLTGRWVGSGLGGTSEEIWSPAADGRMMGMFRQFSDGKTQFYEFEVLEESNQSLVMRIKHFSPNLEGWEEKSESRDFPLLRSSKGKLEFEGLTYELVGPDQLNVTVDIHQDDGSTIQGHFEFFRNPL